MRLAASSSLATVEPLQQPDPLVQGAGEVDLAVHGARGDAGDLLAQAQKLGQLVQHLVLDHGRFHVGHEQLLAPARRRHDHRVDRRSWRRAGRRRRTGCRRRCSGASHSGVPTVAPCACSTATAFADGAVVRARDGPRWRSGQGRFSRAGSSLICNLRPSRSFRPPWTSASSSSPARRPAASRRWRSRSPSAHRGTVINADAMQTYDAFPILTAQPTPSERSRVPHALYGVLPLSETLSAARWRGAGSTRDRALPGSGPHAHPVRRLGPLFADADAGHLRPFPIRRPACATQANAEWVSLGADAFRARLAEKDPAIVARLKPGDRQRHVRAWEVVGRHRPAAQRTGRQARASRRAGASPRCCWRPERGWLRDRIEKRFDAMLAGGVLAEVRAVFDRAPDPRWPGLKAHGAPELFAHFRGRAQPRGRAPDRHRSHAPIRQAPDDVVSASDDTRSGSRPEH